MRTGSSSSCMMEAGLRGLHLKRQSPLLLSWAASCPAPTPPTFSFLSVINSIISFKSRQDLLEIHQLKRDEKIVKSTAHYTQILFLPLGFPSLQGICMKNGGCVLWKTG